MPIIKRYSNRKLYDTEAKQYITLEGIAELIRRGDDVQVLDHESGDDLTAIITAQIIFAQEKKVGGMLPSALFTNLIQAGSNTLQQLRQAITAHPDWEKTVNAEITRRVQGLVEAGELTLAEGEVWLMKLIPSGAPSQPAPPPITNADLQRAIETRSLPSRNELDRLSQRVASLTTELERLTQPARPTRAKAKK